MIRGDEFFGEEFSKKTMNQPNLKQIQVDRLVCLLISSVLTSGAIAASRANAEPTAASYDNSFTKVGEDWLAT